MQDFKVPSNPLIVFMILSCILCTAYLLAISDRLTIPNTRTTTRPTTPTPTQRFLTPTTLDHIVFGIASNVKSWSSRKNYVRLWWRPNQTRGCVFLESAPSNTTSTIGGNDEVSEYLIPPICISEDTSRFHYTFQNGLRSAIRVARVVTEIVGLNHSDVRWFVLGDDDTVFFPENLVRTLSKYDHGLWYYVGTSSESYAQKRLSSFDMAFGGAGIALSYPLAKVLARVFDSCIERYPHLYGSDARVQTCLAELGIGLTHEPGFHQMDVRGSVFGLLASHTLKPLVSLHHLDVVDPIFPKMTPLQALEHLFLAVSIDSQRVMQQTVCYDQLLSWTISVSWGYAVQIFPHHVFLPVALRTQETYIPWRKGGGINNFYSLDMLGYHSDPCRRPTVFFMYNVSSGKDGITSAYRMMESERCRVDRASPRKLEEIRVFSHKLELDIKQLQAPRRHCCDVSPSKADTVMEISIRECGDEELIYMH